MNSNEKYLKYKIKYLILKNKVSGSNKNELIYKSVTGYPIVIKTNNFLHIESENDDNNNSIHSSMDLNNPYNTSNIYEYYMLSGLLILNNPDNYLLIGLGGGYTAKIILKLLPDINLDIVEYNNEIVHVAKEYFNFSPSNKTNIYVDDGVKYIMDLKSKKYDIISLDAFNDESNIPPDFLTDDFFNKIKIHLSDNGLFIINSISQSVIVKNLLEKNFKYYICITVYSKINSEKSYNNLMNGITESINYIFIAGMFNFLNVNNLRKIHTNDISLPIEDMYKALITSINRKK